jgi:Reverse transcriptase (RNA-dependent DNA polymerase)
LVQSARQFFKKLIEVLKSIGFQQSKTEPCLLMNRDNKLGLVIIAVYVDDCYAIGDKAALLEVIQQMQSKGFKLKVENDLSDYLSCEIIFNKDKTKAWLGQPNLIRRLETTFKDFVKSQKNSSFRTPGTPGMNILRPKNDDEKLGPAEQTLYRSAVGTLLQFVKHSRPDLANTVRELSKCMDAATTLAMKELKRVIQFVITTKDFGLLIEPKFVNNKWKMTVCTDSDWAGDKDTRQSVTGFVIFLLNVPIFWKSRAQKAVAL